VIVNTGLTVYFKANESFNLKFKNPLEKDDIFLAVKGMYIKI